MLQRQKALLKDDQQRVKQYTKQTYTIVFTCIVFLTLFGSTSSFLISRRIAKPIHLVSVELQHIAKQDLSSTLLSVQTKDETKHMVQSINNMKAKLKETIQMMKDVSFQIASQADNLQQAQNEVHNQQKKRQKWRNSHLQKHRNNFTCCNNAICHYAN
ncbi:HAMP domain-containing protein [Anoxybacillus sp. CHMUD]|uniref:HAMP domain-containing protein n=1 Tax=Anoxybacillus sp. CHMUD TaxID=2508870 RepID=UPI00209C1801|nr:methyl-accepting chemotaxis protein [Anoxybacillus sp. CHMUD]